jgi:hypothetical protein
LFSGLEKLKARPTDGADLGVNRDYHAIGTIDYSVDSSQSDNGLILYIKPGYHGTENVGVQAYAKANLQFPHERTVDQWFTESQFESYRSLGFNIMDSILMRSLKDKTELSIPNLESILSALSKQTGNYTIGSSA